MQNPLSFQTPILSSSTSIPPLTRRISRYGTHWLALLMLVVFWQFVQAAPQAKEQAKFARQYTSFALQSCERVEGNLPEIIRVSQLVADRHMAGGLIGIIGNGHGMPEELTGRSGGIVHFGFDRPWKKERTPAEDAKNTALIGFDRAPSGNELETIKKMREAGTYVIGLGPRKMPELAEHVAACDVWFDSGWDVNDGVVQLPGAKRVGRRHLLVNMLHGWALTGEIVSALTRQGKMPPMWKSYMTEEGVAWGNKYFGKMQFHDDLKIAPIPAGTLSRAFLKEIRDNIKRFEKTQMPNVEKAANLIADELGKGRKTVVATSGHAPYTYVSKYDDSAWGSGIDLHHTVDFQVKQYREQAQEGALVLRLGYTGMHGDEAALYAEKKQRVILLTSQNPRPEWQIPQDKFLVVIDMGYAYGDASVSITGYPIKILPPSGIMQLIAYEAINVEVLARLAQKT